MNLADHRARVRAAEREVAARSAQTAAHCRRTLTLWRAGWTPGRIVVAGLAVGFLSGRAQPLRLAGSGGLLALLRTLAQLLEKHGLDGREPADAAPDAPSPAAPGSEPGDPPAVWPDPPRREAPPFVTTP